MIITRTPFRITLAGGGCDLPSYYSKRGWSSSLSVAINKYMYVIVSRPFTDEMVRLKYSLSETEYFVNSLKHDLAREALKSELFDRAIEVTSIADIEGGTGLGSSGAYLVGLLVALKTLKCQVVNPYEIAEQACEIEINTLKKPVGKQDQYMAAFGGMRELTFSIERRVKVESPSIEKSVLDRIESSFLMFYTFLRRASSSVLYEQNERVKNGDIDLEMDEMGEIVPKMRAAIWMGDIEKIGSLFNDHWKAKKKITGVSDERLDSIYDAGIKEGALGGKLIGAGAGGFFLFCVEDDKRRRVRETMIKEFGLKELSFRFDYEGSKVMMNV